MAQAPATSSYAEIANETVNLIVDEITASNRRTIEYVKSLWEIARPGEAGSPGASVRNGFDRAEQAVTLTVRELEASAKSGIEFAEKLLAQSKKAQEQGFEAARGFADKALSSAKQVVEAASERIDTLSKKIDEKETARV